MPNLIFLFITLIFLVACEYSRLFSLLTARDVSRANVKKGRGEMTVFSEYFLASVQALMSNLTFDRLCFSSKFSTFDFLSSACKVCYQ